MKQVSKVLSKAEQKTVTICRERVQDVCFRVSDVADILKKREWPQAAVLDESVHVLNQLLGKLESIETEIFRMKSE